MAHEFPQLRSIPVDLLHVHEAVADIEEMGWSILSVRVDAFNPPAIHIEAPHGIPSRSTYTEHNEFRHWTWSYRDCDVKWVERIGQRVFLADGTEVKP